MRPASPRPPTPPGLSGCLSLAVVCAGCAMPGLVVPPALEATHAIPIEADGITYFDNLRAGDLEAKDVESTGHQTEALSWPFRGARTRARFAFTLVEHGVALVRFTCAFLTAERLESQSLTVDEKEGGLGCSADAQLAGRLDLRPSEVEGGRLAGGIVYDGTSLELVPRLGRTQHQSEGLLGFEVLHEGRPVAAVQTHGPGQRLWLQPGLPDPARRGAAAAAFALYILERKR